MKGAFMARKSAAQPASLLDDSLTELQRQDVYLGELPSSYEYPLFSGKQAIESQRRSGYRNTARAVRELVDNSIEAGARNVWVALDRVTSDARKKGDRKETVSALAVIDDGPGMRPRMIRYAMSWGGGTHFKSPTKIAKFGFGLPNSSINQTRHVEVYSRTTESPQWYRCVLDLDDPKTVPQFGLATIPEPSAAELPAFVQEYLKRKNLKLSSGTIVVWSKPDRLTYSQAPALKQHLRHDFGVTYRGLFSSFHLHIEDDEVKAVDPLFLTPSAVYFVPQEDGGPSCTYEREIPVKFWRDNETGTPHLVRLKSAQELKAATAESGVVVGTIAARVARFPKGFIEGKAKEAVGDAKKRFEIRKSRRGISVVRAGREIDTISDLPISSNDRASGLGDWPLLQAYAYHWGVEVRFSPELDEALGIGNDKQTVSPIEDFWRVLHDAELDKALQAERKYQEDVRKRTRAEEAVAEALGKDKPNPATEAAAQAEKVIGAPSHIPDEIKEAAQKKLEEAARERAKQTNEPLDKAREAIAADSRRKQFRVDFFSAEGGVFFKPDVGPNLLKIALINKAHPFFRHFYSRLPRLGDPRARQAVDLLLIALAKAEIEADRTSPDGGPSKADFYEYEREQKWSPFLGTALKILDHMEYSGEEEEEEEEDDDDRVAG
jgi:hypothetical protein